MRKLSLTLIGLYLGILGAFSQDSTATTDSGFYKKRQLTLDEVNFVSGYYRQDGNNSAVTGGIGTEKLSDFSNSIELKFTRYSKPFVKQTYSAEVGVDHYTSASSDKIDPFTISSPSYNDNRFYPTLGWNAYNEKTKQRFGTTASFSKEYDYVSRGVGINYGKASHDNNREFSAHLQAYFDTWSVIYPVELRSTNGLPIKRSGIQGYSPRNSFSGSFSFAQVVNTNLQLLLIAEPTYQQGLLATKYQRVYFGDGSLRAENLPDSRIKIPLALRANYFLGDRVVIRSLYRYYQDNWGLKAHTLEVETPLKLTPQFSISPFYRFYTQNNIRYFAPYQVHRPAETFFTSDYDLSKFTSHYFGTNVRIVPENGFLGLHRLHSVDLRWGHYIRSNGLTSNQLTLALQYK